MTLNKARMPSNAKKAAMTPANDGGSSGHRSCIALKARRCCIVANARATSPIPIMSERLGDPGRPRSGPSRSVPHRRAKLSVSIKTPSPSSGFRDPLARWVLTNCPTWTPSSSRRRPYMKTARGPAFPKVQPCANMGMETSSTGFIFLDTRNASHCNKRSARSIPLLRSRTACA